MLIQYALEVLALLIVVSVFVLQLSPRRPR